MRKVVRYFYRLRTESLNMAVATYGGADLLTSTGHRTIKSLQHSMDLDRSARLIGNKTKPIICKITVQDLPQPKPRRKK